MSDVPVDRTDLIKRTFPKPIAKAFAANNALDRVESARGHLRVFEAAMQYLALTGLARYLRAGPRDAAVDLAVGSALVQPTLGRWVQAVRDLDRALAARGGMTATGADLMEKRDDLPGFCDLRKAREPGHGGSKPRLADVLSKLVEIRNDSAHGGLLPAQLGALRDHLRRTVEELLSALPGLRSHQLLLAEQVSKVRKSYEVGFRRYVGEGSTTTETVTLPLEADLSAGAMYVQVADGQYLEVSPFILGAGEDVVLFSGKDGRGRPVYACPYAIVSPDDLEQAERDLAELAPFIEPARGVQAATSLEALQPFVEAVAADGVVTSQELAVLAKRALAVGLATDAAQADALALRAVETYAPEARVWVTGEPVPAQAAGAAEALAEAPSPLAAVPIAAPPARPVPPDAPPPRWATDSAGIGEALEAALGLLKPELRALGAKPLILEPDEDEEGWWLGFTFKHPVWQAYDLAVFAQSGPDGWAVGLADTVAHHPRIPSPFRRALLEQATDPATAARLALQLPQRDDPIFRSWLQADSRSSFLEQVRARLPAWLSELRPIHERAWDALPEWARALERTPRASALLKLRCPEAEADAAWLEAVARALQEEDRFDASGPWAHKLRDIAPDCAEAHELLSNFALSSGDDYGAWQHAEAQLKALARDGSPDEDDWEGLARLAHSAKQLERSVECWDHALAIDPDLDGALNWKGYMLYRLGRLDEAEAVFRRCIAEGRDGMYPHGNLASVLKKRGDLAGAIEALRGQRKKDGELYAGAAKKIAKLEAALAAGQTVADEEEDDQGGGG